MLSIISKKIRSIKEELPLRSTGWTNRGWLEIVEFILSMCKEGSRKTHVMYRCNLNSKQINGYLDFLYQCSMLEKTPEHPNSKRYIYKTSNLGRQAIESYHKLVSLFKKDPASLRSLD